MYNSGCNVFILYGDIMVNFNMYLVVGIVVIGMGVSFCYVVEFSSLLLSLSLWMLGVWGSLLLDVDFDNVIVLKLFFNGLVLVVMVFVFFWLVFWLSFV